MYDVQNGGFCLVMDPNTGEVLAMASSPNFDPNNYSVISDSFLLQDVETDTATIYQQLKAENDAKPADEQLTDEELQEQAQSQPRQQPGRRSGKPYHHRALRAGSTFKALVLAAALEEGVVTENSHFYCPGYIM